MYRTYWDSYYQAPWETAKQGFKLAKAGLMGETIISLGQTRPPLVVSKANHEPGHQMSGSMKNTHTRLWYTPLFMEETPFLTPLLKHLLIHSNNPLQEKEGQKNPPLLHSRISSACIKWKCGKIPNIPYPQPIETSAFYLKGNLWVWKLILHLNSSVGTVLS